MILDWREALTCLCRFICFAIVTTFIVLVVAVAAQAHWKPQYAAQPLSVQQWFAAQHNKQGQWCCDKTDGHPFYGAYSFNKDGSVTLDLGNGNEHVIPEYMVLKGPNPTGHAVWWYLGATDYCFAPGPMT